MMVEYYKAVKSITTNCGLLLCLIVSFIGVSNKNVEAQSPHKPYPVFNTETLTIVGPYLVDPSQSGMTICLLTDTKSQAKILYWKKGNGGSKQSAESEKYGLVQVGRMHSIRIKNLDPGTTYNYKVVSRKVIRLRPYWPEMGKWTESGTYSFTTFDSSRSKDISFGVITDTHEHVNRINTYMDMINWDKTDFLVHDGDIANSLRSEQQLFDKGLTPLSKALNHSKPLIFAHGNHGNRGAFARDLFKYIPLHEKRYYYARNDGPLHLIVLDTGEDKADTTNVYAGLNRFQEYRSKEYNWFKNHIETSKPLRKAPFRIIVMHQPGWGFTGGKNKKWTELANKANINLIIAGHWHRFARYKPGEYNGNDYHLLVLSNYQVAHVNVSKKFISVKIQNTDHKLVDSFRIDRKGKLHSYPK